jgi:hypothetical protein
LGLVAVAGVVSAAGSIVALGLVAVAGVVSAAGSIVAIGLVPVAGGLVVICNGFDFVVVLAPAYGDVIVYVSRGDCGHTCVRGLVDQSYCTSDGEGSSEYQNCQPSRVHGLLLTPAVFLRSTSF